MSANAQNLGENSLNESLEFSMDCEQSGEGAPGMDCNADGGQSDDASVHSDSEFESESVESDERHDDIAGPAEASAETGEQEEVIPPTKEALKLAPLALCFLLLSWELGAQDMQHFIVKLCEQECAHPVWLLQAWDLVATWIETWFTGGLGRGGSEQFNAFKSLDELPEFQTWFRCTYPKLVECCCHMSLPCVTDIIGPVGAKPGDAASIELAIRMCAPPVKQTKKQTPNPLGTSSTLANTHPTQIRAYLEDLSRRVQVGDVSRFKSLPGPLPSAHLWWVAIEDEDQMQLAVPSHVKRNGDIQTAKLEAKAAKAEAAAHAQKIEPCGIFAGPPPKGFGPRSAQETRELITGFTPKAQARAAEVLISFGGEKAPLCNMGAIMRVVRETESDEVMQILEACKGLLHWSRTILWFDGQGWEGLLNSESEFDGHDYVSCWPEAENDEGEGSKKDIPVMVYDIKRNKRKENSKLHKMWEVPITWGNGEASAQQPTKSPKGQTRINGPFGSTEISSLVEEPDSDTDEIDESDPFNGTVTPSAPTPHEILVCMNDAYSLVQKAMSCLVHEQDTSGVSPSNFHKFNVLMNSAELTTLLGKADPDQFEGIQKLAKLAKRSLEAMIIYANDHIARPNVSGEKHKFVASSVIEFFGSGPTSTPEESYAAMLAFLKSQALHYKGMYIVLGGGQHSAVAMATLGELQESIRTNYVLVDNTHQTLGATAKGSSGDTITPVPRCLLELLNLEPGTKQGSVDTDPQGLHIATTSYQKYKDRLYLLMQRANNDIFRCAWFHVLALLIHHCPHTMWEDKDPSVHALWKAAGSPNFVAQFETVLDDVTALQGMRCDVRHLSMTHIGPALLKAVNRTMPKATNGRIGHTLKAHEKGTMISRFGLGPSVGFGDMTLVQQVGCMNSHPPHLFREIEDHSIIRQQTPVRPNGGFVPSNETLRILPTTDFKTRRCGKIVEFLVHRPELGGDDMLATSTTRIGCNLRSYATNLVKALEEGTTSPETAFETFRELLMKCFDEPIKMEELPDSVEAAAKRACLEVSGDYSDGSSDCAVTRAKHFVDAALDEVLRAMVEKDACDANQIATMFLIWRSIAIGHAFLVVLNTPSTSYDYDVSQAIQHFAEWWHYDWVPGKGLMIQRITALLNLIRVRGNTAIQCEKIEAVNKLLGLEFASPSQQPGMDEAANIHTEKKLEDIAAEVFVNDPTDKEVKELEKIATDVGGEDIKRTLLQLYYQKIVAAAAKHAAASRCGEPLSVIESAMFMKEFREKILLQDVSEARFDELFAATQIHLMRMVKETFKAGEGRRGRDWTKLVKRVIAVCLSRESFKNDTGNIAFFVGQFTMIVYLVMRIMTINTPWMYAVFGMIDGDREKLAAKYIDKVMSDLLGRETVCSSEDTIDGKRWNVDPKPPPGCPATKVEDPGDVGASTLTTIWREWAECMVAGQRIWFLVWASAQLIQEPTAQTTFVLVAITAQTTERWGALKSPFNKNSTALESVASVSKVGRRLPHDLLEFRRRHAQEQMVVAESLLAQLNQALKYILNVTSTGSTKE